MTQKQKEKEVDSSTHIKNANAFLDLMGRVKCIKWKDILDTIFKIFFLVIFVVFVKFIINPKPTIEYYRSLTNEIAAEEHEELIDKRLQNSSLINSQLRIMQTDMDVDRTFVMEFHNGNNNPASLPFWWGDMSFEYVNPARGFNISDSWINVSMTRYNFFSSIISENCWIGSTEEVSNIDASFAKKLDANDIQQLAIIFLYNLEGRPLGLLGVSNSENFNEDYSVIMAKLLKYSQIINPLLIGK